MSPDGISKCLKKSTRTRSRTAEGTPEDEACGGVICESDNDRIYKKRVTCY